MPISDLFGLIRTKKQTDTGKYLASSVNIVGTGEKGQLRPPFSQQRGINSFHSWIYAASTINANAVASVPIRLYKQADNRTKTKGRPVSRKTKAYLLGDGPGDQRPSLSVLRKAAELGDEVEEVTGSNPVMDLLQTANPFLNGFDLSVLRILYGELTGNSYLHPIIDPETDQPVELWPLAPQYVEVIPCEDNFIEGYVYGIDAQRKQIFEPDEVIHFRRPNPGNYYYGMGKVEAAFGAVLSNEAVHQMDLSTFANSARPDYAVVVKGTPTGDQLDRFQQQVEERLKGTRKDGNFIAVSGDVQFTPLNFPPKDLAGREDIVEEIAAIFGVPVTMLKANDPNLASATAGFSQWREGTILPLCRMDEQELNQSLLPMFGLEDEYFLAYDNPVPKDEAFELQARQSAVAGGWQTPNEARMEEGRDAVEDPMADKLLYSGQPLGGPPMGPGGIMPPPGVGMPGQEAPQLDPASGEAAPPDGQGSPQLGPGSAQAAPGNDQAIAQANLNGAQIASVITILDGVAAGTIMKEGAIELIMATGVPRESAERMVVTQDEAKPEAVAEAQAEAITEEEILGPVTEEEKSIIDLGTLYDVSILIRKGILAPHAAVKTLQGSGMTRKRAERVVKKESKKANVLRRDDDLYDSCEEASRIAEGLGCQGCHEHDANGTTKFMPCADMDEYQEIARVVQEAIEKDVEGVDLKPTAQMAKLAKRGLALREKHNRGGTEVGVARARDISNRENLSAETIGRMANFFGRHRVDLDAPAAKPGHKEYPSAGVIAWLLWGGDPANPDGGGAGWAKRKQKEIESAKGGTKGGEVAGLVPKFVGTRMSAAARNALGSHILEKSEDCGTGAGGFKPGNNCAEGHGRPRVRDVGRTRGSGITDEQRERLANLVDDKGAYELMEAHEQNEIDRILSTLTEGDRREALFQVWGGKDRVHNDSMDPWNINEEMSLAEQTERLQQISKQADSYRSGSDEGSRRTGMRRDFQKHARGVIYDYLQDQEIDTQSGHWQAEQERTDIIAIGASESSVSQVESFVSVALAEGSESVEYSEAEIDNIMMPGHRPSTEGDVAVGRKAWDDMNPRERQILAQSEKAAASDYEKIKNMTPAQLSKYGSDRARGAEVYFAEKGIAVRVDPMIFIPESLNIVRAPEMAGLYDAQDIAGSDKEEVKFLRSGLHELAALDAAVTRLRDRDVDLGSVRLQVRRELNAAYGQEDKFSNRRQTNGRAYFSQVDKTVTMKADRGANQLNLKRQKGWLVKFGTEAEAIHEIGHALHDQALLDTGSPYDDITQRQVQRAGRKMSDRLFLGNIGAQRQRNMGRDVFQRASTVISRQISKYAATDPCEFVAESSVMRATMPSAWKSIQNQVVFEASGDDLKAFVEQHAGADSAEGFDGRIKLTIGDLYEMSGGPDL